MYSVSLLVLACAVLGASAQGFLNCGCNNGYFGGLTSGCLSSGLYNGIGYGSAITPAAGNPQAASSPVFENPTIGIPGFITPSACQDTCNCVQTLVKPSLRQELFNIPSVQRFVQTTSTPVVDTQSYISGGSVDVPTPSSSCAPAFGAGFSGYASPAFTTGFSGCGSPAFTTGFSGCGSPAFTTGYSGCATPVC